MFSGSSPRDLSENIYFYLLLRPTKHFMKETLKKYAKYKEKLSKSIINQCFQYIFYVFHWVFMFFHVSRLMWPLQNQCFAYKNLTITNLYIKVQVFGQLSARSFRKRILLCTFEAYKTFYDRNNEKNMQNVKKNNPNLSKINVFI